MTMVRERWEQTDTLTGDLITDCVQMVTNSITRVGFSHVRPTPLQNVIICNDDNPGTECDTVIMNVVPVPSEWWETPSAEIERGITETPESLLALQCLTDRVAHVCHLQGSVRCDVSCVCLNEVDGKLCVRVHHLRNVV